MDRHGVTQWMSRLTLTVIFCFNVGCACAFIIRPAAYTPGFEVNGVAGETLVRGIGILFLMWNVTYPLAIWRPWHYRYLLVLIIIQQAIGSMGETWMWLTLPPGHETLRRTGWGFIIFDTGGLVAMLVVYALMTAVHSAKLSPRQ